MTHKPVAHDDPDADDEWSLVDWVAANAARGVPEGAVGPGDDAAVLPWAGGDLVTTTDLVAEGTHFFPDADPVAVGRFAAAVNLSDLAAMGAVPRGLLAASAAPRSVSGQWFRGVAQGLVKGLSRFDCPLLGGDTKTASSRFVSATAFGSVPEGTALLRSGARSGDVLVVSGSLGGPGTALRLLNEGRLSRQEAMKRVFDVQPRIGLGVSLRESGAHAAVDTSDSLARAAVLLAKGSALAVEVDLAAVPVEAWVEDALGEDRATQAWRKAVIETGGEYELVAAVAPSDLEAVRENARGLGVGLTPVGVFREGAGARGRLGSEGFDLAAAGWRQR